MQTFFQTDKGKVRQHNEDCVGVFTNESQNVLAVVADGMGGHLAGDVASKMAIEFLESEWKKTSNFNTPREAENWLSTFIDELNSKLYTHAESHEECKGMGTTLVAIICTYQFFTIAHIGDSRCYFKDSDGFTQITDDHTLVAELVKSGQISKEDAEIHPRKNVITRALGTEETVKLDVKTLTWEGEDTLLLCSDGLSNKISFEKLEELIYSSNELKLIGNELVSLANGLGGEDNISLAIVKYNQSINQKG
ncbi:Stp1/IreP family PP2C-type Ser/Thr phosphatase [Bacillus sp. RG28]|uniref:protein-serine/threonine phosphatase n=1 Tax=Gottfriedia endophytica TaxID=2820819 RepID=A0A940NNM0_9BACI|nr:Stp1/IreP family PP2C-type Ser/Thr phosphatase [Gottfriedia endophytica]MBP0724860.1 Stp1/IreP family PP2C-type Ser/Thr phosphatase [Gottfriedia endophytica]